MPSRSGPIIHDHSFNRYIMRNVPHASWLLAVLLNVVLMGTGLCGLWVARRWVIPWMRLSYDDAYVAAAVVQSVMVLYGLIAALTAVGVWTKFTQVEDIVSAEATTIRRASSGSSRTSCGLSDTTHLHRHEVERRALVLRQVAKLLAGAGDPLDDRSGQG